MIKSFKCKETENIFKKKFIKKFSSDIQRIALRKLLILEEKYMRKTKPISIHPGEILLEEFMKPLNISQYKLAKNLHVGAIRISEIIHGKRSITADTAIRLGRYFKMEAKFWMNLQAAYDLEKVMIESQEKIYQEVKPLKAA